MTFEESFLKATKIERGPYPFQEAFAKAEANKLPQMVDAPTGLGKTAMAALRWLGAKQSSVPSKRIQYYKTQCQSRGRNSFTAGFI